MTGPTGEKMRNSTFVLLLLTMSKVLCASVVSAVEVSPSQETVSTAVREGERAAETRGDTSNRFGKYGSMCGGWGFLQTKLWNIREASKANAKKMKPTPTEQVEMYLSYQTMLVTYALCTSSVRQTDHHMVLRQGERVIQPQKVSISRPEHISGGSYLYTVQAHFDYAAFDPQSETMLIVIPDIGDKREYLLKLSEYP